MNPSENTDSRITIRPAEPKDRADWLRMRHSLWPEAGDRVEEEIANYFERGLVWGLPTQVLLAEREAGGLAGFLEVSLRQVAEGCVSSPVGYIEGWYIDPDLRRKGIGTALVQAAEQWAREMGCVEIASDCLADNHVSHAAHQALGYRNTIGCILFRKPLVDEPVQAQNDYIALIPNGIWTGTAVKLVSHPNAGGIDIFLGTTRAERNAQGQDLIALDYEAYPEMAAEQMRDLARRARQQWPILKLAILHRMGRVPVGEPSVCIAVSTAHRGEAFAACRWLIDTLKTEVAIWKKEIWSDGQGTWVAGTTPSVRSSNEP